MKPNQLSNYGTHLDEVQSFLNSTWVFPLYRYPAETGEREDAWIEAEARCRTEISQIARCWIENNETFPQSMTDEQTYWIRLRFKAAARLLDCLVLDDGSTIFSVGRKSRRLVAEWVLIDWWAGLGWKVAFHEILFEHFKAQESQN